MCALVNVRVRMSWIGEWVLLIFGGRWRREQFWKSRRSGRVYPSFGVGTVWRGISASGGWRCIPSLGETQCRRQAWPNGGVRQLGVRGQAQGRPLQGTDLAEGT